MVRSGWTARKKEEEEVIKSGLKIKRREIWRKQNSAYLCFPIDTFDFPACTARSKSTYNVKHWLNAVLW
jgi:hypothetical protein